MEDFLRDSLGIDEENTMQVSNEEEVSNVLASIEEEVNKEDAVEEVVASQTELPPSLQKLDAQKAALLKLGMDLGTDQKSEEEEQTEADQEEGVSGKSYEDVDHEEESNAEQQLGNYLLGGKKESSGRVGGIEQAEKKKILSQWLKNQLTHLNSLVVEKKPKSLMGLKRGLGNWSFTKKRGVFKVKLGWKMQSVIWSGWMGGVNLIEGELRERQQENGKKGKPAPKMWNTARTLHVILA